MHIIVNDHHTWDASICCDKWNWKGFGELVLWEERLPFSNPLAPDIEANKCPMLMVEKALGVIANCPGWNKSGCPVLSGLKKCWLCKPERARLCKWLALKCDGLSVWTIRGEKPSLTVLRPTESASFLELSDSFKFLLSNLSFSKFLMLKAESVSFLESK